MREPPNEFKTNEIQKEWHGTYNENLNNNEIKVINKINGQPGENFQIVATDLFEKKCLPPLMSGCARVHQLMSFQNGNVSAGSLQFPPLEARALF